MKLENTSKTIEEIFSPIKMRIILYLDENEYATLSSLIQHVKSNHKILSRHLEILKSFNIVREYRVGKIRIFFLNRENEVTQIILRLISALRSL